MKFIMNEETLDDTIKKADQQLGDPVVAPADDAGQIESVLDRALKVNEREIKRGGHNFQNILFVGPAGTGKTSRVKAWAKANGINLVTVLASVMDDTDLGGAISPNKENNAVQRLASTEFDELDNVPRSVLFLDEYNRAPQSVRGTLLTLIQDHTIRDDRVKGKQRELKNFLFTVAAINPASAEYNTDELDDAEQSRFKRVDVYHDKRNTMQYLVREMTREAAESDDPDDKLEFERKAELAKALLSSRDFKFDTDQDIAASKENGNGLILSARTFTNCLMYSDGTKEDFIDNWDSFCNSMKKGMVERILAGYKDKEDKANDVLKGGTQSAVFGKKEENDWDKLAGLL